MLEQILFVFTMEGRFHCALFSQHVRDTKLFPVTQCYTGTKKSRKDSQSSDGQQDRLQS